MKLAKRIIYLAGLMAAIICILGAPVKADTLSASWYSMTTTDPDVGISQGIGGMLTTVGAGLGSDGLPVLNATGKGILHDFNAAGELEWWSPALDSNVTVLNNSVYPTTITLPFVDNNMYTNTTVLGQNGDDSNAFLTAKFTGDFSLTSPASVTFNVCSDDDEFVYLSGGAFGDGTIVVDNGGIHATSCTGPNENTSLLSNVAAGDYTLTIFYADRQHTGAVFQLTASLGLTPPPQGNVPEPGTLSLLALGLVAAALALRNRAHAA